MALFWSKKSKAEKNYDTAKTVKATKTVGDSPQGRSTGSPKRSGGKPVVAAKITKKAAVAARSVAPIVPAGNFGIAAEAIVRPHITEKSGILSQSGSYTFVVAKDATKATISKAVVALYKVTPVKVAVLNHPDKKVFVKGRRGIVSGYRKAVVTVKKGDKIDFV